MTSVSSVNFTGTEQQTATKKAKPKKEVVYVSKNPDAMVNATGVVAGTAGMVGGAVLGGVTGLCKLPAGLASAAANADYASAFKGTLDGFKSTVASSPELSNLVNAFKSTSTPEAAEEIVNIAKTLSERLHTTFKDDAAAKAVIDKVIDPVFKSVDIPHKSKIYIRGLLKAFGIPYKPTTFVGDLTSGLVKGIAKSAENIQSLTPEEKAAWGKVANQVKTEFMTNPKLKTAGAVTKAVGAMVSNFDWIKEPFKNAQKTLAGLIKDVNKTFGNAPLKTIGKWSGIGAVVCGTISTLGWFGLKKGLMTKEVQKAEAAKVANA